MDAKYFPFKSPDLCVDCYEREHHRVLHKFRKKLKHYNNYTSKQKNKKVYKNIDDLRCPYCSSYRVEKKGIRNGKQTCYCETCGKNWTIGLQLNTNKATKKEGNVFYRETSLMEIWEYLKLQETFHAPIIFYYRDDVEPRKIYNYYLDKNYINVKTGKGYFLKFLISRIRKIYKGY